MSEKAASTLREVMEREKARLLEEAAAKQAAAEALDREMAEVDRLAAIAAKHGFSLAATDAAQSVGTPADGTLGGLIARYRADPRSGYHKLRFRTRESYESSLRRIEREHGQKRIDALDIQELNSIYSQWTDGGKVRLASAHGLMGMLRILASFGAYDLKDQACRELRVTLHDMRFEKAEKRDEPLTADHAVRICETAVLLGLPSIAIAQALQFEHKLGQWDVIGEWLPVEHPGTSEIIMRGRKWLRGLRWHEIDDDLVLRRPEGKSQKPIVVDLKRSQMAAKYLRAVYCKRGEPLTRERLPASGAIIRYERDDLPYQPHQFRRTWRKVADAAGVPKTVKNRDSRAATDEKSANEQRERETAG